MLVIRRRLRFSLVTLVAEAAAAAVPRLSYLSIRFWSTLAPRAADQAIYVSNDMTCRGTMRTLNVWQACADSLRMPGDVQRMLQRTTL